MRSTRFLAAVALLATLLPGTAIAKRSPAERVAELVNASRVAENSDATLALLLAREAARLSDRPDVTVRLREAVSDCRERVRFDVEGGGVYDARFSPDGKLVVTVGRSKVDQLWKSDGTHIAALEGHSGSIEGVSFSADGRRVATLHRTARLYDAKGKLLGVRGDRMAQWENRAVRYSWESDRLLRLGSRGEVQLWDAEGPPAASFAAPSTIVVAEFSPDGSLIATGSEDGTVGLWNTEGTQIRGFDAGAEPGRTTDRAEPGAGAVQSAAFSADGKRLLCGFADGTAHVWAVGSGEGLTRIDTRGDRHGTRACFSGAGWNVLTYSDHSEYARLWRADGTLLERFPHRHDLRQATAHPLRLRFLTVDLLGVLRAWNASWTRNPDQLSSYRYAQSVPYALRGHAGAVESARFSPDGHSILSASSDGTARIWAFRAPGRVVIQNEHDGKWRSSMNDAYVTPDGSRVVMDASGRKTGVLGGFDRGGDSVFVTEAHDDSIRVLRMAPDGKTLLTAARKDAVPRLWSLDGEPLAALEGHTDDLVDAVFSPDGKRVATASEDGTARLWDLEGKCVSTLKGSSVAFSPDGKRLLTGGSGMARVWSATGKSLMEIEVRGGVGQVAFLEGGRRILTAARDAPWHIWTDKGKPVANIDRPRLGHAAVGPDGMLVASYGNGWDGVRLWDSSGELVASLPGTSMVKSVTFSPDGAVIATGSFNEQLVRFWGRSGRELGRPLTVSGQVSGVRYSADGRYLLVAVSGHANVRLHTVGRKPLLTLADEILCRDFTEAERRVYRDLLR